MRMYDGLGLVLALAVAGCAVSSEVADEIDLEEIDTAEGALEARGVDTVPAYFNHDNHYAAADDSRSIYAHFNSHPGKRLYIDLHQRPWAEPAPVAFKLYKVRGDGRLSLVKVVPGFCGSAFTSLVSSGTGSYVVQMASSGHLADLELNLGCSGGDCSPDAQPGDLCGGIAGIQCAEGLFCSYEVDALCGASDMGGTCAVAPKLCTKQYAPVCGCDGQTYGNACVAAAAGVSIQSEGECPAPIAQAGESCGGFRRGPSPVCADGLYCSYRAEDTCGFADAPGTCAEKPAFCTQEFKPVCGCNGQTYSNACVAAMNGASVHQSGECEKTEQE